MPVGIELPEPAEVLKRPVSWIQEFREFIARGNVIDLAVGVIIGAAFNDIVKALVDLVLMPPIGLLLSGLDFSRLQWVLKPDNPATKVNELVAVQYGAFLNTLIKFVIVAWAVFMLVKMINVIRRREAEKGAPTKPAAPPQEVLLAEIRDLLKAQGDASKVP
ncbi:large-conductance mechanosensitive channel protein MscL [Phenylobacterium sp.]|jgi:large conductance mechanosensitive channel|uniref:large-conductance mechanosensitive channel protein MscL n=1 Tax=Phenylobacterium sp. TaxID=1871053 RepID=UPI002F930BEB